MGRPQDPFFTRAEHMNPLQNREPGRDDDIIDRMPSMGGSMMPIDADADVGCKSVARTSLSREKDTAGARKRDQRARKKNRRGRGGKGPKEDKDVTEAKTGATDRNGVPLTQKLPKQRPGESAKAYSRRVDKALREQLRDARRKAPTENQREKKRARAEAKKLARE